MENSRSNHPPVQNHHHSVHHVGYEIKHPQVAHGSPYHVHPFPAPVSIQQAFQSQEASMFHPKGLKPYQDTREGPILGRALCLTSKDSPVPGRVSHLNEKFQDSVTMYSDTDELVAKISSMFPTVSHTHIRILLKKYYNREAVVISALQVEKHPIATPGPLTMSPSAARLHMGAAESLASMHPALTYPGSSESGGYSPRPEALQGTSGYFRGARPRQTDHQPTKHSSPKMKLKYLKSLFPKADETFILDVLAKNDNSVQMAGQDLEGMGFVKKDQTQPKKKEPTPQPVKKVVLLRTVEDRQRLFEKLQSKYWSIAEQLIMIALETVEYNEEKADHLLSILLQERTTSRQSTAEAQEPTVHVDEMPDVAWSPNDEYESTTSASPPPAPAHAPPYAPVPAYAIVPAYMKARVPVQGYGIVAALLPVHVHVPINASAHVAAHMAANTSAHMATHGHHHVHPHEPVYALVYMPAYAATHLHAHHHVHAHAHAHAHVHAPCHVHAHAHCHVHAHAHSHVHAHAHCHVHAHAAASTPPPAPATRPKKMRNEPKIESKPQLEAPSTLNDLPQEAVSKEPVVKTAAQPEASYQSQNCIRAAGPNPAMRQGPQDNLLLKDYMPWNGPNRELRMSQTAKPGREPEQQGNRISLARGPCGLDQGPSGIAQGPSGIAKGPSGLSRGSKYRQQK